ncbi:MAG: cupin domain-containing protein [Pseudomonadota bacterium]
MDKTSTPIMTTELPWMPLSPGVSVRPLRFAGDERSLQLRVDPGVSVGRHRHTGAVHAFNVSGSRELGTGEIAGPGAYVYEPPGNEDCWRCVGDEPCIVQINLTGRVIYVGDDGEMLSFTDTARLREQYLAWCAANGVAPQALDSQ